MNYLIPILALLLIGCGKKEAKEEEKPLLGNSNSYQWTQPIRPGKTFDEGEMQVAKSVCQSFQRKRATLSSRGGRLTLDYSVKRKECFSTSEAITSGTGVMSLNRAGDIRLVSQTRGVSLFEDVLTDLHPRLQGFCSKVLSGVAPNNTVRDGSFLRYQVNFFQAAGYEWVQVVEFKDINGQFYPYLVERVAIVTAYTDLNEQAYGFAKRRTVYGTCGSGIESNYTGQEWL
jgi:hypothetical protein